ncbi:serine/threonine-protein kinase TAO3-like isoform X2 [Dysidea avara]|uniref:serine/threonine-protein kinase TAO3-like isoform X2 n=1 Tax=Dysidea avara TaxID=196820 RepID=UPI0033275A0C
MPKGKHKLLETAEFSIIEHLTITPHELGRGSYGTVYAAKYNGKPCVAKEMHAYLNQVPNKNGPLEICIKEINTLSTLKHPSIVQFLGVYFKEKSEAPILVMEMMWKNLVTLLEEQPNQLPLLIKTHILYDVACGLQYLHGQKKPVVHRDLSANNILLTENLQAKIADLGQAKALETLGTQKLTAVPGNVHHMAPETFKHGSMYDSKMDIFSFGCTVLHVIAEKFPRPSDEFVESVNNQYLRVSAMNRRKEFVDLVATKSSLLQHITTQCLQDEPSSRPTAIDISKELKRYSEVLEASPDSKVDQYKLDMLSLLRKLQSQESQIQEKDKLITQLNHEKDANKDSLAKKDEYVATLQQEFEAVKNKLEQTEEVQCSLKQDKASLQKALTEQTEVNKSLNMTYKSQRDRLREEVNTKKEEVNAVNLKCIELQQENQQLNTKLKDEGIKVTNLEDKLQKLQKENESLQTELNKSREDAKTKQEEIKACNLKRTKLQQENEGLITKIKDEQQKLANMEDELQKRNNTIDHLNQEREGLVATTVDLTKTKEALEMQLSETQEKCTTIESTVMGLEKKLKEKESKLDNSLLQYTKIQQNYKRLQSTCRNYQQTEASQSPSGAVQGSNQESQLLQKILEIQDINEKDHQILQQQLAPYAKTLKTQEAQMSDLKKKLTLQKQQLEEKSYRLSTLESSCNELQESLYAREEKIKCLEGGNAAQNKQIENNSRLYKSLEKDFKNKEESLKRKEEELQLLKKEHADEINKIHAQCARTIEGLKGDIETVKLQTGHSEVSTLLEEKAQFKNHLMKNTDEKFKKLDDELKNSVKTQKLLKRQIKHQEVTIKEKMKYIEQLEEKSFEGQSSQYFFDTHWHPYVLLPSKKIRASAVAIKDKVFVTGGYQEITPQGEHLDLYLKSLRCNEVFCFHTTKCRCDSIVSPVVLGGVASVNGQCLLVSGAEGNTLTGNVYVLCEEGSDEQWKKFSEPVPTPRILPCVCCYGERWMIVCGGYACKEGSSLLEAVNVVEILDTTKGEWYTLPENSSPNLSTILACSIVGDDIYVIGDDNILRSNCNKLISEMMVNSGVIVWIEVPLLVDEVDGDLHPFGAVEVAGELMIIASFSDSEDDVTCVLTKDTTDLDTWRKMSEAVECQHCSAVVVTPTLELLLIGGSEKVTVDIATDNSQCGTLIPALSLYGNLPIKRTNSYSFSQEEQSILQENVSDNIQDAANTPANLDFIGPIHTKQFDHKGGTFQSPVHKVSIVVPPNAIDDGEKVTVYMGATTSGPFDLPEDCKLRSAVVWLGSGSNVVLKRSLTVVVPHSAVLTSPQHHSMMRFLTCEDCEGPRYKFTYSLGQYEIDNEQGWTGLNTFSIVAIAASTKHTLDDEGAQHVYVEDVESDDEFHEAPEDVQALSAPKLPPARYLAKLFWPRGQLPNSFRADIVYSHNIPTELYKVKTLYRKAYYEDNGTYPEIVGTELMVDGDGTELKCVLPCSGSSECDCLSGWSVTQMNDISEVHTIEKNRNPSSQWTADPMRSSFKFTCLQPRAKADLTCFFVFEGVERLTRSVTDSVSVCLRKKYGDSCMIPFIVEKGIYDAVQAEQREMDYY